MAKIVIKLHFFALFLFACLYSEIIESDFNNNCCKARCKGNY